MKQIIVTILIISTVLFVAPMPASAQFQLVPCGNEGQEPCQFKHLIFLLVRMINYLISIAAIVAMYQIVLAGFNLVTALGNPEKIMAGKEGISHALIGLALIALSFVFINFLVNGIFGQGADRRQWWRPECIYGIGQNAQNCPNWVNTLGGSGADNSTAQSGSSQPTQTAGNRGNTNTETASRDADEPDIQQNTRSDGPPPANLQISPTSAVAGSLNLQSTLDEGGVAVYDNNNLTITITGENLESAKLATNAKDINNDPVIVVERVRPVAVRGKTMRAGRFFNQSFQRRGAGIGKLAC